MASPAPATAPAANASPARIIQGTPIPTPAAAATSVAAAPTITTGKATAAVRVATDIAARGYYRSDAVGAVLYSWASSPPGPHAMAKKKRKKRTRAAPPATKAAASERAARKEAARRERERAIRAFRRRRRLVRGGIALAVIAALAVPAWLIFQNVRESRERRQEADALAAQIGCGEVQQEQGADGERFEHVPQPPEYQTTPASFGPHSGQTLPPEPAVWDQPFDPTFEFRAVHNLEHGYVAMYYRQDGEAALSQDVVSALAELAEGEDQVFLAPHPALPEGENLALVAWNRIRHCEVRGEAGATADVARTFIEEFRDSSTAPEPQAA